MNHFKPIVFTIIRIAAVLGVTLLIAASLGLEGWAL